MRIVLLLLGFFLIVPLAHAACIDLDLTVSTELSSGEHYLCPDRQYSTPGLRIAEDETVLDCQGSHLYGSGRAGVFVNYANNVTIRNCVVEHFKSGIVLNVAGRVVLDNVRVHDNIFGVAVFENSSYGRNTSIYWNVSWFRNVVSLQRVDVAAGPIKPPEFAQLIALDAPPEPEQVREEKDESIEETEQISPADVVFGDASSLPTRSLNKRALIYWALVAVVALVILLFIRRQKRSALNWSFYPAS